MIIDRNSSMMDQPQLYFTGYGSSTHWLNNLFNQQCHLFHKNIIFVTCICTNFTRNTLFLVLQLVTPKVHLVISKASQATFSNLKTKWIAKQTPCVTQAETWYLSVMNKHIKVVQLIFDYFLCCFTITIFVVTCCCTSG